MLRKKTILLRGVIWGKGQRDRHLVPFRDKVPVPLSPRPPAPHKLIKSEYYVSMILSMVNSLIFGANKMNYIKIWRARKKQILGMSCLLAWMWAFPMSGILTVIMPNNEIFLSVWRILFFLGLALSFLAAGLADNYRILNSIAHLVPAANLVLTTVVLLPFLLYPELITNAHVFKLSALTVMYFSIALFSGMLISVYFIRWGTTLYSIDKLIRGRYMALMIAVAALLLSITLFAFYINIYFSLLVLMVILILSFFWSKDSYTLQAEPQEQLPISPAAAKSAKEFWLPFSFVLLSFNILSGITHNTIFPLINQENFLAPMFGAVFYGMASLLCGKIIDKDQKTEKTAVIGLALLGISFLFLPLAVNFHLIILLQIFMEVSYAFIDVFIWCSIAQSAIFFRKSSVRYLGIGLCINVSFILFGMISDSIIKNITQTYNFFYLAIFAGALLFIGIFPAQAIQSTRKIPYEQTQEISSKNQIKNILLSGRVLTVRETEVLELMLQGLDNSSIQDKLGISRNTLKTHISNIYGKTGIKNRRELFQKYIF